MYDRGFVCTRPSEGLMQQTRSLRINLSQFELSSENKRILRKTEELKLSVHSLPYDAYSWEIGKLGKEFYEAKFGDGTFSANKVKELLTAGRNDFNTLLTYSLDDRKIGYALCVETDTLLHYSYPFYDLDADKNTGMGMMLRAIEYARESNKHFCYLGSAQRPGDTYKLQFKGLEWFDGNTWRTETTELKQFLQ